MKNIHIDYAEDPIPMEPAMMDDLGKKAKMGIYVNNAKELVVDQVTVGGNEGEAFDFHNIESLIVDGENRGSQV